MAPLLRFDGVRPVLHVPFGPGPDQPVQLSELGALADRMLEHGVDGLVILGLASEAWALTEHEREEVVETVAEHCRDRAPFVVGMEGATAVAADRARRARAAGAAGLMVLPPATARSTDQLVDHFSCIADAAGIPILVQDSPQITGVTLTLDAIVRIAEAQPLAGSLKVETPGAGAKVSAAAEAGIEIVAGWGGLSYLEQLRRGASGCMPGCDLGPAILALDRQARHDKAADAEASYRRILPLLAYEVQSLDLLILGAKRLLRRQGIFRDDAMRSPGREVDAHEAATLDALIDRLAADGVPGFEGLLT